MPETKIPVGSQDVKVETVSRPIFFRRSFLFRVLLIVLIIAFGILTYFVKHIDYSINNRATFSFDLKITQSIQQIQFPIFDSLMRFLSTLGDFYWGTIVSTAAVILTLYLRKIKDALMIFISTAGVGTLSIILKAFVGRPRPDPHLINQIGNYIREDSFPSGHVLHAIGLYGFLIFLAIVYIKNKYLEAALVIPMLLIIIFMGVSRIYLGAHWFSDTLGSYLIGSVWLYIMVYIYQKIREQKKKD